MFLLDLVVNCMFCELLSNYLVIINIYSFASLNWIRIKYYFNLFRPLKITVEKSLKTAVILSYFKFSTVWYNVFA